MCHYNRKTRSRREAIESKQLRYFVAVAEHLHFGQAAESLRIVQSALSAQIKNLETDLGVRLLNRQKRAAVSLTDAALLFLPEAQAALKQLERADLTGRLAGRGELGQVELGYVASAAVSGLLSASLKNFRDSHAGVRVHPVTMETPAQLRAIAEGRIDVGFVRTRPQYPLGVTAQTVHWDQLRIAFADTNPLAAKKSILAADLCAERFIVPQFDERAGFKENLARLGQIGGFMISTAWPVADFITAISMAAAGYGVALVPGSFERLQTDGVIIRTIEDYQETITLALAWRRAAISPAVRAFVEATQKAFAKSRRSA